MSKARIKVAIVNYLNTKPFIHGLKSGPLQHDIELIECIPADCATLYHLGKVDLSLVPVGSINHPVNTRISDYGIASDGPVASVCILSEVPAHEITSIFLDYQSRTSVLLTRILFKKYWHHVPLFLEASVGYESLIQGTCAGLVIGDRALELKSNYEYVYDLGAVWKSYTSLPFVYAIWLNTHPLADDFVERFNQSLEAGVNAIPSMISGMPEREHEMLTTYFNQNIRYRLNKDFELGLTRFMDETRALQNESVFQMEKIK